MHNTFRNSSANSPITFLQDSIIPCNKVSSIPRLGTETTVVLGSGQSKSASPFALPSGSVASGRLGLERERLTSLMKFRHRSGFLATRLLKLEVTCERCDLSER